MRNITVMIEGDRRVLYLSENLIVDPNDETFMKCIKVTIFWNYKNVISGVNDTFTHNSNLITIPEGYWTMSMIKGIRTSSTVMVGSGANMYYDSIVQLYLNGSGSGKVSAYSSHNNYTVNLGTFGTLLGFDKNFSLPMNKKWLSQNKADLNRGLKYVTVSCDIVDEMKSTHTDGLRSSILTTLPLPNGGVNVDLGKVVEQYDNNHGVVPIKAGSYNKLIFDVSTNIGDVYIGNILLELSIDSK